MVPKLILDRVSLTYHTRKNETTAIRDLSLDVFPGEFVSIVGPSGCGKSTLLSLISGLLKPSRGRILIDGINMEKPTPKIGYMLQHDYLLDWRTVETNCLLGLEIMGVSRLEALARVRELLVKYGLADFAYHYPRQLSGGMRQRVALIRTLAIKPEIVLLDEPFSAVDYQTRLHLEGDIGKILRQEEQTVILVTHDIGEAIALSDRIVVFTKRPASVKTQFAVTLPRQDSSLVSRESKEFYELYQKIWVELDV